MAVKIHSFMIGIVFSRFHALGDLARNAVRAAGQNVTDAGAFAAFIPAAFNLVRGDRATP